MAEMRGASDEAFSLCSATDLCLLEERAATTCRSALHAASTRVPTVHAAGTAPSWSLRTRPSPLGLGPGFRRIRYTTKEFNHSDTHTNRGGEERQPATRAGLWRACGMTALCHRERQRALDVKCATSTPDHTRRQTARPSLTNKRERTRSARGRDGEATVQAAAAGSVAAACGESCARIECPRRQCKRAGGLARRHPSPPPSSRCDRGSTSRSKRAGAR